MAGFPQCDLVSYHGSIFLFAAEELPWGYAPYGRGFVMVPAVREARLSVVCSSDLAILGSSSASVQYPIPAGCEHVSKRAHSYTADRDQGYRDYFHSAASFQGSGFAKWGSS